MNNSTVIEASIWQFLEAVSRMNSSNVTHLNRLGLSAKMVTEDMNSKVTPIPKENALISKLLNAAGDTTIKMPMLLNDAITYKYLD